MHYEWNVTRVEELESLLNDFETQRASFHAAFGGARKDSERQMEALGKRLIKTPKLAHATLALNYLVATGAGAEAEDRSQSSHVRNAWMDDPADSSAIVPDSLGGLPPDDLAALASLPRNSLLLRLDFTLDKPYLSKDDTAFHVLDNPVRKEWVFRVPAIASTGWKGALRATFWQRGYDEKDLLVRRLFGFSLDDDDGQAGCLTFFPTYFKSNEVGIEMINPHDRTKGTGIQPIPFEAVCPGARGVFWLLYAPRDAAGTAHLAEDLGEIGKALADLLSVYGVGAKVSSGYGTATPRGGRLFLRAAVPPYAATPDQPPLATEPVSPAIDPLDEWLTTLLYDPAGMPLSRDNFLNRLDGVWEQGPGLGKKPKGEPAKWKKYGQWHDKHAPKAGPEPAAGAEPDAETGAAQPAGLFTVEFTSLNELGEIAGHIGRHLNPAATEKGEAGDQAGNLEVAP